MSAACANIHGFRRAPRPISTPLARVAQPLDRLLRLDAVARSEDRNGDAFGHLRNQLPVGRARVRLLRRAPVNGEARRPRILHHAARDRGVDAALVPAGAHLDGHRDASPRASSPARPRRVLGLTHQAAAGVVLRNLRHRDSPCSRRRYRPPCARRFAPRRHLLRIAAEDLDRTGRSSSVYSAYSSVRSMPRTSPSELTISVTTRPHPPWRLTRRRKAVSVMPAIGARRERRVEIDGPIFILEIRLSTL